MDLDPEKEYAFAYNTIVDNVSTRSAQSASSRTTSVQHAFANACTSLATSSSPNIAVQNTISKACTSIRTVLNPRVPAVKTMTLSGFAASSLITSVSSGLKLGTISCYITDTEKLCVDIESKIDAKEITKFVHVEQYSNKLLEQVVRLKNLLPPSPPSSSDSDDDDGDSDFWKKIIELLRTLRQIIRIAKKLLSIAGVIAAATYPPAAPALLEIIAVLEVVDAILTLIIGGYDIIYQNGNLWDNLLEIIIAILEIIPYLKVPNAKKIKEIGQKGCELVSAFRTMIKPMKENPTAKEIYTKVKEVYGFFKALIDFAKAIESNFP